MAESDSNQDIVVFTTDGTEIRCNSVEEGNQGIFLKDRADHQVGYVPYNYLQAVYPIQFSQQYSPRQ